MTLRCPSPRTSFIAASIAGLVVAGLAPAAAARTARTSTTTRTWTAAASVAPTASPSPAASPTVSPSPATPAPSGQTTTAGLLPVASLAFPSRSTGWTTYAGQSAGFVAALGRTAPGALAVTSAGPWTGASSPVFPAVPGARYTANGYVRAAHAGSTMSLRLRFLDASGAVIPAGTQVTQGVVDSVTAWSPLAAVVGFAPAGAVRGEVAAFSTDAPVGAVHYVDDVSVTQTTGTAAPLLGPLRTSGRDILDALGRRVTLRGIHLDGMEWSSSRVVATDEVLTARLWGANMVRLPLNEGFALPGDCAYDPTCLPRVDALVRAATAAGMLALIDLHTNALTPCAAPTQQSMPDAGAVPWWRTVAARYKANPLVAFDLYNEPHDVTDSVWRNGGTVTSSGVTYTAPGMQTLYDTVRGTGAANLVFTSGSSWATTFPADAPLRGTRNLVYAVHAYTCPTGTPGSGATCYPGPAGVLDPSGILRGFDAVATTMPVVVTEFGWPSRSDGRFLGSVIDYATAHTWSGWVVFAFDGSTQGLFDLVKDTGPVHDPAISGMAVMTRMLDT